MADPRITWFTNHYDGRNTSGLGVYWGYLVGALDQRNIAQRYHAPVIDYRSSNATTSGSDSSMTTDTTNDDNSTTVSVVSTVSTSNGQQMPPNSMPNNTPNGQQMPSNSSSSSTADIGNQTTPKVAVRVSVITPNLGQPAFIPPAALQPADNPLPFDWAEG